MSYKVGDKVMIIEVDNTHLHKNQLNKVVEVTSIAEAYCSNTNSLQPAIMFDNDIFYALFTSVRKPTKLDKVLK